MKSELTYLLLLALAIIVSACERRPLYYDDANVHVVFDFDDKMPNVEERPVPELMRVRFNDPTNGVVLYSEYIGPNGGYLKIDPAAYHVYAHRFDTEFTQVRNEEDIKQMEVYTNQMQSDMMADYFQLFKIIAEQRSKNGLSKADDYTSLTLVNQPDHFYYGKIHDVNVPNRHSDDDSYTIEIPVKSTVKTYRLEICTITGLEYVIRAEAYVTGQMTSKLLYTNEATGPPCNIYVPMVGASRGDELTSTFNTFGHQPETPAYVVLRLLDMSGNSHVYEWDVTDQFDDPANVKQIIHVEHTIEINPPEGQPMVPTVHIWDQSNYDIIL